MSHTQYGSLYNDRGSWTEYSQKSVGGTQGTTRSELVGTGTRSELVKTATTATTAYTWDNLPDPSLREEEGSGNDESSSYNPPTLENETLNADQHGLSPKNRKKTHESL